jgi:hypothetical protein
MQSYVPKFRHCSESGYEHRGHSFISFGRLSEAKRTIIPMNGVKARLQKKYPQAPNFLLEPIHAMMIQSKIYTEIMMKIIMFPLFLDRLLPFSPY